MFVTKLDSYHTCPSHRIIMYVYIHHGGWICRNVKQKIQKEQTWPGSLNLDRFFTAVIVFRVAIKVELVLLLPNGVYRVAKVYKTET